MYQPPAGTQHAGADGTGLRDIELIRGLLDRHANLYIQIRAVPDQNGSSGTMVISAPAPGRPPQRPGGPVQSVKPERLALLADYPDRFVLGQDRFYRAPGGGQDFLPDEATQCPLDDLYRVFLDQVLEDPARKIAYENVLRIYRLG